MFCVCELTKFFEEKTQTRQDCAWWWRHRMRWHSGHSGDATWRIIQVTTLKLLLNARFLCPHTISSSTYKKKYIKDTRPPWKAHTYTQTHLLSLAWQHARITSLMQPSRKMLPSPAKIKVKGVQQQVEISQCVYNKICEGPKSSSSPKWTANKQFPNSTAQNSSSGNL